MNTQNNEKPSYLTGKLLLAMPSIGDDRFDHAVIYVCVHDENGAMGLVINNPAMDLKFEGLVDQLEISDTVQIAQEILDIPVMQGGPVDKGRGFLLHRHDFSQDETIRVDDRFGVTGTLSGLREVAAGNGPQELLFILGYSGWDAAQLDGELRQNAWLVADADADLLFHTNDKDKWGKAIRSLGFDPAMLSGAAGRA